MVRSYRGQEVDMDKIVQQQGEAMSLGNTRLNGRGDEVVHGKVVKTRAERLKEYLKNHPIKKEASVNLAEDEFSKKVEKEIEQSNPFEEIKRPKVRTKTQPQPQPQQPQEAPFIEGLTE